MCVITDGAGSSRPIGLLAPSRDRSLQAPGAACYHPTMNSVAKIEQRMSREAYRAWALEQHNGRFERRQGIVCAIAPERSVHGKRKARIWSALDQAIGAAGLGCFAYPDGMTVEVDDSDYEPDAVVRCGRDLPDDALVVPDPMIIVEVLSPSTGEFDQTTKLTDYFTLPSVHHYLIVSPDEPRIIHHRRGESGIENETVSSGPIRLDPPGITIVLDDIYR